MEFDALDIEAETSALSDVDTARMQDIHRELKKIWLVEETKARQRARDRDILEGDRNTKYFQAVANQRRRKTLIHSLDGPTGVVTDTKDILEVATNFYKDLFRKENKRSFTLKHDFFDESDKVSDKDNDML